MCGSVLFLKLLSRWLSSLLVHLWTDQRIPGPMSCRCPSGSLETPPRWHATIYITPLKVKVYKTVRLGPATSKGKRPDLSLTMKTHSLLASHVPKKAISLHKTFTQVPAKGFQANTTVQWGNFSNCSLILSQIIPVIADIVIAVIFFITVFDAWIGLVVLTTMAGYVGEYTNNTDEISSTKNTQKLGLLSCY